MSELLPINSPLLPRLRKAAAKDDEALRWLMDSARHWARAEFLRREETVSFREFLPEAIRGRMYHLELHVVAVRYGPLRDLGRDVDKDQTVVGLLREGCNEEYLSLYTGRGEDSQISGMLRVYDVFELPEQFRPEPRLRPPAPAPAQPGPVAARNPSGTLAQAIAQSEMAGAKIVYDHARLEYAVVVGPDHVEVFDSRVLAMAFEYPDDDTYADLVQRFWEAVRASSVWRTCRTRTGRGEPCIYPGGGTLKPGESVTITETVTFS